MSFNFSENSCPSAVFKNIFFIKVTGTKGKKFMCQATNIFTMPSLTVTETISFELDLTAGTFLATAHSRQTIR